MSSLIETVEKHSGKLEPLKKSFLEGTLESKYHVRVSKEPIGCCIGMVDMVASTKIAAGVGMAKMSIYYETFLNHTAEIISEFGGDVIKNIGDCLLFCFPRSKDYSEIRKCLECALALCERHDALCNKLARQKLPCVDYRISLDYGPVIPMSTSNTIGLDIIGPSVNMCCKINRMAEPNCIVIGGDLKQVAMNMGFDFCKIQDYSLGLKNDYPVYSLSKASM